MGAARLAAHRGTGREHEAGAAIREGDDEAELDLWDTKWVSEGHAYERLERPLECADLVVTAER